MTRGYTLDPQARELLLRVARAKVPPFHTLSPEEARGLYRDGMKPVQAPLPEVSGLLDTSFEGPGGTRSARICRPAGARAEERLPAVLYFHGGGWTFGDLDTHDAACRTLSNFGGFAVVSIDYRRAPEHKFPAAVDDALAALRWILAEGPGLGIDPRLIAVAGDSAGGNLAAALALLARDARIALVMQVLIYPALDLRAATPSHAEFGRGYLLERDTVVWTLGNYLRGDADVHDPRASPLLAADHRGLAPAYIVTAGFDPLLDEGAAYADKLLTAGVPVTYECFEGMLHGFMNVGVVLAAANHALYRDGHGLQQAFKALPRGPS